jgi:lysophospholipase L1-like esterase
MPTNRTIDLTPNSTLLFTGDSITDCNRGLFRSLGTGYVRSISKTLKHNSPNLNISIKNTGISGNTTRDLLKRWQPDCIDIAPDVLSILIGINDLWSSHAEPEDIPNAVLPDEFESNYDAMLSKVRGSFDCRIILIEPFMFCTNTDNAMFVGLNAYRNVVSKLAIKFDTVFLGIQNIINNDIKNYPLNKWSDDFVHPTKWAHEWIAKKWLEIAKVS